MMSHKGRGGKPNNIIVPPDPKSLYMNNDLDKVVSQS